MDKNQLQSLDYFTLAHWMKSLNCNYFELNLEIWEFCTNKINYKFDYFIFSEHDQVSPQTVTSLGKKAVSDF